MSETTNFEDAIKANLKKIWFLPATVKLKGSERKLPVEERNQILLDRALKNKQVETVYKALELVGIPVVTESLRVIDAKAKIVEAEGPNGELLHASPNPFQDDVQAFIAVENLSPKPKPRKGEEPQWMSAPSGAAAEADGSSNEDMDVLSPTQTRRTQNGEEDTHAGRSVTEIRAKLSDVREQTHIDTTPPPPEAQATEAAPQPQMTEAQRAPVSDAPINYAELARQTAAAANTQGAAPTPVSTSQSGVFGDAASPTQPSAPPTAEGGGVAVTKKFVQPTIIPPTKTSLAKYQARSGNITIAQALQELGFQVDIADMMNPNLDVKLVKEGVITVDEQYRAKALAQNLIYVDVNINPPNPQTLNVLDEGFIQQQRVFPYTTEDDVLVVLTDTPARASVLRNRIMQYSKFDKVEVRVTAPHHLNRLINDNYATQTAARELNEELETRNLSTNTVELEANNAVNRYIRTAVITGINHNASDIHLEPSKMGLTIRYRIDKKLRQMDGEPLGSNIANNVIRVIKIMARMDVNDNRRPQDSNITLNLDGGHRVGLRISTLPQHGGMEKVVIRLLKEASQIPDIEKLGLAPKNLSTFKRLIGEPDGILLVTGPTGSGKSFTLYSALKRLATPEKNIQTLEDPVEYELPGLINQTQINDDTGLTFAAALRSTLRQDPDIILVGEIRDSETANAAIAAANTGHLVLSTLHTNDAASAIQRLRNLEVENYNIEPSLKAVIAQRLVRRVCKECAEEMSMPEHVRVALEGKVEHISPTILRAKTGGCPNCNNGYKGLVAVHELLEITPPIKIIINNGGSTAEILEAAEKDGHYSLLTDAYIKINDRLTTLEEVNQEIRNAMKASEEGVSA